MSIRVPIIVAGVLLFLVVPSFADFYTDWLWVERLGAPDRLFHNFARGDFLIPDQLGKAETVIVAIFRKRHFVSNLVFELRLGVSRKLSVRHAPGKAWHRLNIS